MQLVRYVRYVPIADMNVSVHLLDVGTRCFVEQRLFGTVHTEQNFKRSIGVGGYPVGLLSRRGTWAEMDIHRSVRVLLEIGVLRRAAEPGGITDEGVSCTVVDDCRPVLLGRCVCWHREAICLAAVEPLSCLVPDGHQIKLPRAERNA